MIETIACIDCRVYFTISDGALIEAACPKCGGEYGSFEARVYRTDSFAFAYAVSDELRKEGKDPWRGDELGFTEWQAPGPAL